jgi:hypothetical protein
VSPVDGGVRIAELVGTLSYAADLGLGQPMEHCLRQTVIAGRLAALTGAGDRDRATTFYLGLLMNTHCHADAAEQATWFADDIGFKAEGVETLGMNTAQTVAFFVRRLASHGSVAQREGFQNPAAARDQRFQAAGSYSLIRPPRTGRRRIGPWTGFGTSASGRGGRSCSARCGLLAL